MDKSSDEVKVSESLKPTLLHNVPVFNDGEILHDSVEGFEVVIDGLAAPDQLISASFHVPDGELIERMPEQFPKDAGDYNEAQIEYDVAHELGERDEVVEDVKMGFGSCKRLQLGSVRHSYINYREYLSQAGWKIR